MSHQCTKCGDVVHCQQRYCSECKSTHVDYSCECTRLGSDEYGETGEWPEHWVSWVEYESRFPKGLEAV